MRSRPAVGSSRKPWKSCGDGGVPLQGFLARGSNGVVGASPIRFVLTKAEWAVSPGILVSPSPSRPNTSRCYGKSTTLDPDARRDCDHDVPFRRSTHPT